MQAWVLTFSAIVFLVGCEGAIVVDESSPQAKRIATENLIDVEPASAEEKEAFDKVIVDKATNSAGVLTMDPILGWELYDEHCKDCHDSIDKTPIRNKIPNEISSAIEAVSVMQHLTKLTAKDIDNIAIALSDRVDLGIPKKKDEQGAHGGLPYTKDVAYLAGVEKYNLHCASCHNKFEQTTKSKRTVEQITFIIKAHSETIPKGPMGDMTSLTAADLESIVYALNYDGILTSGGQEDNEMQANPAPEELTLLQKINIGSSLYEANCKGCHAPLLNSAKLNSTAKSIGDIIAVHAARKVGGIASPGPMAYLEDKFTATQLEYMAMALSETKNPELIEQAANALSLLALAPMTSYHFMAANADHITGNKTRPNGTVKTDLVTLRNHIYQKNQSIFGGFCTRHDHDCSGARFEQDRQVEYDQSPAFTSVRAGLHGKYCEGAVTMSGALEHMVIFHGSDPSRNPTLADLDSLSNSLKPGWVLSADEKSEWDVILTSLESSSVATGQRWQLIFYTLCKDVMVHSH